MERLQKSKQACWYNHILSYIFSSTCWTFSSFLTNRKAQQHVYNSSLRDSSLKNENTIIRFGYINIYINVSRNQPINKSILLHLLWQTQRASKSRYVTLQFSITQLITKTKCIFQRSTPTLIFSKAQRTPIYTNRQRVTGSRSFRDLKGWITQWLVIASHKSQGQSDSETHTLILLGWGLPYWKTIQKSPTSQALRCGDPINIA